MKKILSLVLTAAMVLSLVTMTGFASWTAENIPAAVLSVEGVDSADCEGLVPGDQVEVTLTISGLNTDWSGVQAQLNYDAGKFTLVETDVSAVQALFGGYQLDKEVSGEIALASAVDSLDEDNYGEYLIEPSGELLKDIVIMSAVFTVKDSEDVGASAFSISTSDANGATPYRLAFTKESGLEAVTTSTDDLTETVTIAAAPAPSVMIGDVNGDGIITAADAQEIKRYAAELDSLIQNSELNAWLKIADINGDGLLTAADAQEIERFAAELDSLLDT